MSPQRELGGAQSPAENPNRFNMFGYCLKLFGVTVFCLLTHQLALVARIKLSGSDARFLFSSTTTKTNRIHEPPT